MMTPGTPSVEPDGRSPLYAMTPCPPWCVLDHAGGDPDHHAERHEIRGFRSRPYDSITVYASDALPAISSGPKIRLHGYRFNEGGRLYISFGPEGAASVALLVEMLAGASAAQHRALAAGLRDAAAAVAGNALSEPGPDREGRAA